MLKNIPDILSPELLKVLAEMGHGDEIVIGDCNFPAASMNACCVRCNGHRATDVVDAILELFPLDTFVDAPVTLMEVQPGKLEGDPPIWKEFEALLDKHQPGTKMDKIDRFDFYERAKKAYATVATSEKALYACIILKKGVLI
ncbi:MAG: fucose isomerase [Christensenellaceae bacterium]|nr:fucose isomerase [Christensenellaceae bacterium]